MREVQQGRYRILFASVVVGLLGLAGSNSAAAGSEFLTVDPATDLVDGQLISIEGDVGATGGGGLGQCPTADVYATLIDALNGCSAIVVLGGPTYSATYAVQRSFQSSGRTVDCTVEPCSIRMFGGDFSFAITLDIGVPLTFAPAGPLLTVEPAIALRDQQTVDVGFSGGEGGVATTAVQCVEVDAGLGPDQAPNRCIDLASMTGVVPNVTATVVVERWVADGNGVERDCATDMCRLGVAHGNGPVEHSLRDVGFASGAALGFSPSIGTLADGDTVTVAASNVDKNTFNRTMQQCVIMVAGESVSTIGCDATDAVVDSTGQSTYDTSFTVSRFVTFDSTTYDCSKPPGPDLVVCSFRLVGYDGPEPGAATAFVADSLARLRSVPEFSITPNFRLPRVSEVTVLVDASSDHDGFIGVCPTLITPLTFDLAAQWCDGGAIGPHGREAEFSQTVTRGYESDMGYFDCSLLGCDVVYLSGPDDTFLPETRHRRRLSFDKSIDFEVGNVAIAGEPFEINAVGYQSGQGFVAIPGQCGFLSPFLLEDLRCEVAGPMETDFDGDYNAEVSLDVFIEAADGTIDCSGSTPRCGVILFLLGADMSVLGVPGTPLWVIPESPF